MTEPALRALLSSPLSLFILMVLASFSNGLKQLLVLKQTGTPMSCARYFSYAPETITMLLTNAVAFTVLILTDQLNYASALGIGYGANSIVDLLPGKRSAVLKSTPDDPEKIQKRYPDLSQSNQKEPPK